MFTCSTRSHYYCFGINGSRHSTLHYLMKNMNPQNRKFIYLINKIVYLPRWHWYTKWKCEWIDNINMGKMFGFCILFLHWILNVETNQKIKIKDTTYIYSTHTLCMSVLFHQQWPPICQIKCGGMNRTKYKMNSCIWTQRFECIEDW